MSADIVNLRLARKARRRSDAAEAGAVRRAKFGRSGAERKAEDAGRARSARHLDGHLRETVARDADPSPGDGDAS